MNTETGSEVDVRTLRDLNRDYIEAVRASDVHRFDEILAPDFNCSLPDGSLIDRAQFLQRASRPLDIHDLEVHDVEVRLLGEAAVVQARTTFTTAEGHPGTGRYTDIWSRRDGAWRAVAAHFTRNVA
jgi:ketosteroid isomerase-like protein